MEAAFTPFGVPHAEVPGPASEEGRLEVVRELVAEAASQEPWTPQ